MKAVTIIFTKSAREHHGTLHPATFVRYLEMTWPLLTSGFSNHQHHYFVFFILRIAARFNAISAAAMISTGSIDMTIISTGALAW